jgi:hypothetical protein
VVSVTCCEGEGTTMNLLSKMRMLMAEQDGVNGNGAIATPPAPSAAVPSEPQATGAAPAIDVAAIEAAAAKKARDAAFAEMRRDGLLRNKPKKSEPESTAPTEPAARSVNDLVRRASHFGRAIGRYEIGDGVIATLEKMVEIDNPDDVGAWVASTMEGMNIKPRGASDVSNKPDTSTSKAPIQPSNATPVTAAGATPPPRADLEDSRIIGMSEADVAALRARKGDKWFVETLLKQSRGQRVRTHR